LLFAVVFKKKQR